MASDNPLDKLTDWLTKGKENYEEKTRIMNQAQLELYTAYRFLAEDKELGLEWMGVYVKIDAVFMESFKGARSDDVVNALSRLKEEEEKIKGLKEVDKILSQKKSIPG